MATALAVGVTGAVIVKDQPAQAITGTGANTQFIKTKLATDYYYYKVKDVYTKEKPTKAEIKADQAKASKINKVLKAQTQERKSLDENSYYKNKELFPARKKADYKHKTTVLLDKNSKTSFTVQYRYYQSVTDRQAGGYGDYKYKYQNITVDKKTGKIKYGKMVTVKNKK